MADWQIVRYDPEYSEPLDPEIIPLCDALNAAGFPTTCSCCGHGFSRPFVTFEHTTDELAESLARFVMSRESGDFRAHYTFFQKNITRDGCDWQLNITLTNASADVPQDEALGQAVRAISEVAESVRAWTLR